MGQQAVTATLALVFAAPCMSQGFQSVQASHIEANVPPAEQFDALLRRDLASYFEAAAKVPPTAIEATMLRDGPTQSGLSYPKFYLWVKTTDGNGTSREGAVRVAAIERKRFEVTNFLSRETLSSDASAAAAVFPAPLLPAIAKLTSGSNMSPNKSLGSAAVIDKVPGHGAGAERAQLKR